MKVIEGTTVFKLNLYFVTVVKLNLELQHQMELQYFDPEYWGNKTAQNVFSNSSVKSLHNGQLDAHLFYFTICLLQSSTSFEHYMLIIKRMNCTDAASGIVLSVSGRPVHRLRENCSAILSQPVHWTATDW